MRRIAVLLIAVVLAGCAGTPDYLPLIDAGLLGGEGITQAGKSLAVERKDVAGCFVTCALLTTLASAKEAVDGWLRTPSGPGVIPGVDIDLAECVALSGKPLEPVLKGEAEQIVKGIADGVLPAVEAVVRVVVEGSSATCREKSIADGVLRYIRAVAPAVVDEMANPDGMLSIPEVAFHACPEAVPE